MLTKKGLLLDPDKLSEGTVLAVNKPLRWTSFDVVFGLQFLDLFTLKIQFFMTFSFFVVYGNGV